jgi:hypothetical protein
MIKLYKRWPTGELHYHEAWTSDGTLVEHWGKVGERGETKNHEQPPGVEEDSALRQVLAPASAAGYAEIEDPKTLIIEYELDSWGEGTDVERRAQIEDRMNELLGWTGLGHCDGGSIGSGTMEVCCLVVDFDLARRVIERDLQDTPFEGYSRIYEEGAQK